MVKHPVNESNISEVGLVQPGHEDHVMLYKSVEYLDSEFDT